MISPDDPMAGRAYRTSREAFGVPFYADKPNRDWLWFISSIVVVLGAAYLLYW